MNALPQGQYVKHYRYGFGLIIQSDEEETSIEFELHGPKKFLTRLLVVERSDWTPPKRFRAKWVKTSPALSSLRKAAARRFAPKLLEAAAARTKG
jgi:hypothetical protein